MHLPHKIFILLLFILLSLLYPVYSFGQEYKPDEVIVKMRPSFGFSDRLKFHREEGGQLVSQIKGLDVDILRFKGIPIKRIIERFKKDPRILYAEPNFIARVFEMSNDPALVGNLQWGLLKIGIASESESAWNISRGLPGVKVAVLDTGISQNHEDLNGKVAAAKNCSDSATLDDLFGHGTHVAGIISANTNNNLGIAGVGYSLSLINAKGLGDTGSGYYSWIANCMIWAADAGARVINMSLGGTSDSRLLSEAVDYAWNKGVVVVAAAGNYASSSPSYPAYYKRVLSVGAVDQNDVKASFSNYGSWVKVAAPGVGIYSTLPTAPNAFKQQVYGYASGTSMATPFVSGLAGLILSYGNMDNNTAANLIMDNADKISGTGRDWVYGRINGYRSLLEARFLGNTRITATAVPTATLTPTSMPTPTLTPTTVPTITPTPTTTPTPTVAPKPTFSKSPWSRLCKRFGLFCN